MAARARSAVTWTLLGAGPGLVVVLVAVLLMDGEMELTVGAPGIWLAVVGATVGLVVGLTRRRDHRP